jgi:hypothetical protein
MLPFFQASRRLIDPTDPPVRLPGNRKFGASTRQRPCHLLAGHTY